MSILGYSVDKLVRHNIPNEIEQQGNRAVTTQLRGAEHFNFLLDKLREETHEVRRAETRKDLLEELADVTEVCYALARKVGYTTEELTVARVQKYIEKGGFDEGTYLHEVHVSTKGEA